MTLQQYIYKFEDTLTEGWERTGRLLTYQAYCRIAYQSWMESA